MFPFLIGTVRTLKEMFCSVVKGVFPFLIGTVRTEILRLRRVRLCSMFPFLIGTVRTKGQIRDLSPYLSVSIPHRYGKNSATDKAVSMIIRFPFLIGTVRTLRSNKS